MYNPITEDQLINDREYPTTLNPVSFFNNNDKLKGTLFLAEGKGPHPIILLLHGFPGNETNFDLAHIYRRAGFNVLVFYYRGCWGSEGVFSFNNTISDVNHAVSFIRNNLQDNYFRTDTRKIIIIGYSMGAFAGIINVANDKNLTHICSIGGFNFGVIAKNIQEIPNAKEMVIDGLTNGAQFINSNTPQYLYNEIIENKDKWDLLNYSPELANKNVLLIGAKYDNISTPEIHHIPLVNSISRFNSSNLEHTILETGHSFCSRRIELAEKTLNWLNKIKED